MVRETSILSTLVEVQKELGKQKDDRRTIGGAGFSVSNIQDASIDLFHSLHLFSLAARMTPKAARPPATTSSIPIPLLARSFLAGRSVTHPAHLPR